MTSGALPSTRPRVWDTSGATPHAARVALECALESVWTVPTDGVLYTKSGIRDSKKNSVESLFGVRSSLLERCDSEVLAGNRRARMDATLCA